MGVSGKPSLMCIKADEMLSLDFKHRRYWPLDLIEYQRESDCRNEDGRQDTPCHWFHQSAGERQRRDDCNIH